MALETGIWFLVNIGWGGPLAEDSQPRRGMTCPSLHRWPPPGMTETSSRRQVLRQVMQSAQGLHHTAVAALGDGLAALAKRSDDSIFTAQFEGKADEPLASDGVCLAPAFVAGDPVVELMGEPIGVGDIVAVVLRGALLPLTKVFAGVIDREGFPAALFYLRTPEQLIEVPLSDVLYSRKIKAPREYDGHFLLADADPFIARWRERFHLADTMEPVGTTRTAAWVDSMTSILELLRSRPAE